MTTHFMLRRALAGVALTAAAVAGTAFAASAAAAAPSVSASTTATPTSASPSQPDAAATPAIASRPDPAAVPATGSPTSPLVAEVAAWVANGGEKQLTTLGTDFGALEKAANTTDLTTMGAGCVELRNDVESAQAYAPIPDASAQRSWADALAAYERGAIDCVNGTGAADVDMITQAANEIMVGTADLDNVTTRLSEIAGLSPAGTTNT